MPVALATLTPKCVLCVLTYTGFGAGITALDGREFCGASGDSPLRLVPTTLWLVWAGFALFLARRVYRKLDREGQTRCSIPPTQ